MKASMGKRALQLLLAGVAAVIWLASPAEAGTTQQDQGTICPICSRAANTSAPYAAKAGHTLMRGAANALFGWTELIRQPALEVKAGGTVLSGMAKGFEESVKRTVGGAGELLTFWTPKTQHGYVHFARDCPLCAGKPHQKP